MNSKTLCRLWRFIKEVAFDTAFLMLPLLFVVSIFASTCGIIVLAVTFFDAFVTLGAIFGGLMVAMYAWDRLYTFARYLDRTWSSTKEPS